MDTNTQRRPWRAVAIAATAILAVAGFIAAPAQAAEPASTVSINLEGTWKFIKGDNAQYSSPTFNDSAWVNTTVPGDGANFSSYDGFAWYRLTFTLPAGASGQNLIASLGYIDDADEAYLNGVKIGSSGSMPPNANSQWFERRLYPVPASAPVFGGTNVLAVRINDMNGGGGWYQGPIGIYSKDAIRANVYGIGGALASAADTTAVKNVLATQKAALAAGNVNAYLATLDDSYEHDGYSKDRRARELQQWVTESGGSLTLSDGEVEVVTGADGKLIADTNRSISGTRNGQPYVFQAAAQQFLRFDSSTLKETGNYSRFFRDDVDSHVEGTPREFVTYLPPSYYTDPDRHYPVVYLLHGINGGSREWEPRNMDDVLDGLAAQGLAESIVVMPDGDSLWYVDQLNGGVQWRTMFLTEMMPLVDAEYRTLPSADFRALSGISMGGFGAWSIGLAHPELFSSIASHIGALSLTSGGLPTPLVQAAAMTGDQLKHFSFYFDACENDEYRFDNAARTMDTTLTGKGVPHTWTVYPTGNHNDACWMPHVYDSFKVHSDHWRAAGLVEHVAPNVSAVAAARCIAGKATLTVTATNNDTVATTVNLTSAYGTKAFPSVLPAKNALQAFTTRLVSLPAGVASVVATGVVNGHQTTKSLQVPYSALNCG